MANKYAHSLQAWRDEQDANLRRENDWLALAGLFWLQEGENSLGAHPDHDIPLPGGRAAENLGSITLQDGKVWLHVNPGRLVTVNGEPAAEDEELAPDTSGQADRVEVDGLAMVVLERGERFGIRLWDNRSPAREKFPGRRWYAADESYRVQAKYIPYDPPKNVPMSNILGDHFDISMHGRVEFKIHGDSVHLDVQQVGAGGLFLIFKDATAGENTYPPGRYLQIEEVSPERQVTLDFNRAYNPPCAFTNYATCTLPPPQNILPHAIKAGELYRPFDH